MQVMRYCINTAAVPLCLCHHRRTNLLSLERYSFSQCSPSYHQASISLQFCDMLFFFHLTPSFTPRCMQSASSKTSVISRTRFPIPPHILANASAVQCSQDPMQLTEMTMPWSVLAAQRLDHSLCKQFYGCW
jgi:hypothetical protein